VLLVHLCNRNKRPARSKYSNILRELVNLNCKVGGGKLESLCRGALAAFGAVRLEMASSHVQSFFK
jgi:hypothetical protein